MRNYFDSQLEILNNDIITLGSLCESAIACSVKAMLSGDKALARRAQEDMEETLRRSRDIESLCLKLLLRQQPVARDLRLISAALKMITDMERISVQAGDIAEIMLAADLGEGRHDVHISDMAQAAIKMVSDSIDAFVRRDVEMADAVIAYDDRADELFVEIKNDLINLLTCDRAYGSEALDLLMVAKYLERIADHAVNIAGWVVFSITGEHREGVV